MPLTLRIALRFLTAQRRSMLMSLACIVLGVGLFVVTQATTRGFEGFFIQTILGSSGAIKITDRLQETLRTMQAGEGGDRIAQRDGRQYVPGVEEPAALSRAVREFDSVTGVAAVLSGSAVLRGGTRAREVGLYGIELDDFLTVSNLGGQITEGRLEDFRARPDGLLLGQELAARLGLKIGDAVTLQSAGQEPRAVRVAAIFESGVGDIDRLRVYLHLAEARSLLRAPQRVSFLQVSLRDPARAPIEAERMTAALGYSATSWQSREKTWLEVFRALRLSSGITVSVFTVIAGLAMFNTLAMLVIEKTREIAILRAMGCTQRDVRDVFLWQAVLVLALGTVLGWLLGAGVTWTISHVPIRIRGIFSANTFVVSWSWWHYVWAAVTASVMVIAASLIPARRAARLEPGDVVRGHST